MNHKQKIEVVHLAQELYETGKGFWSSDYDTGRTTYEEFAPEEIRKLERIIGLVMGTEK